VVAYYPPADLEPLVGPSERFPALDFPASEAAAISPIRFISDDDPPTLLVHGDKDELVPIRNSEVLSAALEEAGVPHDFVIIEGAPHGFRTPEQRAESQAAMVGWFKEYLTE
jgi:dipeptidyl aminopeptidase/acylaminoacyl peptidase